MHSAFAECTAGVPKGISFGHKLPPYTYRLLHIIAPDAFRVEAIYLCGITARPPHAEIHKTALGAEETVEWAYFNDTPEAVEKLRASGYTVCAVEQAEGSVMLDKLLLDKTKKYAIIMGNEVNGVQQNVVDSCDLCVEIPQYGTKHSLNVAVTTGIVIWDFFKQLSE